MNTAILQRSLTASLAIREALGFRPHPMASLLTDCVQYVRTQTLAGPLRAQLAVEWACRGSVSRSGGAPAARLTSGRGFLHFLRASAPDTQGPDQPLGAAPRRSLPDLFSTAELTRLMATLEQPPPRPSLCPLLWATLGGLLASAGLRIGEALRLTEDDVGLEAEPSQLRMIETKFHKSRLVPLHPSTTAHLRASLTQRRARGDQLLSAVFFPTRTGQPLQRSTVIRVFPQVTPRFGRFPREGQRAPS